MKELTTGDNKTQFNKWYINDYLDSNETEYNKISTEIAILFFHKRRIEEKIGVLLAYYDSLVHLIIIDSNNGGEWDYTVRYVHAYVSQGCFKSRNEAYQEAFKAANKLINDKLK